MICLEERGLQKVVALIAVFIGTFLLRHEQIIRFYD